MCVLDLKSITQRASPPFGLGWWILLVLISVESPMVVAQISDPVQSPVPTLAPASKPISDVQPLAETTLAIGPLRFVAL